MIDTTSKLMEAFRQGRLEVDLGGHFAFNPGPVKFSEVPATFGDHGLPRLFGDGAFLTLATSSLEKRARDLLKGSVTPFSEKAFYQLDIFEDFEKILGYFGEKSSLLLCKGYDSLCSHCGEFVEVRFEGKRVFVANPCSAPGGLKPWDLEIDVPSGKLVFRNDMRDMFPSEENYYVNLTTEIKKCEQHYAELGMFHCFVGNTCPGIYVMPDKRVVVGRFPETRWEEGLVEVEIPCPEKEFKVGGVVTDLWWFSACDYDDFHRRGGQISTTWVQDVVVKMPEGPGRYRLTSYASLSDHESLKEFAVIRKVAGDK